MRIEASPRTLFILTVLFTTFCVVTTAVTFTGILHRLGQWVACPGAQEVVYEYSDGGSVDPVGNQGPIGTKVVELDCMYADGTSKTVGNDQLFINGLLAAAGIGVLLGSLISIVSMLRNRKAAKP